MVDIDLIKKRGGDPDKLKSLLNDSGKNSGKNNPKLKALYDRLRSHISEGVSYNLKNYRLYYALDLAWNAPLRQPSFTLLQSVMDKKLDDKDVVSAVESWGLSHLIVNDGEKKTVNIPVFFSVFIPLVRAYVTIRWSKIFNDRKHYPLFKYEPLHLTLKDRVKSDVITDRVQKISQQYDYLSVLRQSIFQMLHYGYCLQFPIESWHSEEQTHENGSKEEDVCVREGIRYHMPHPTRTYWDMSSRMSTINSDTGMAYLGYWTIKKWRDIRCNKSWWNLDKVSLGSIDWASSNYNNFFATVGEACAMNRNIPVATSKVGILDRESEIGFYTNDQDDLGVMYTEAFERLNPKEYGLFDYDHEIWMRFAVASDDTILFAEPLPYAPAVAYIYDSNENQSMNSSLSLEIMPSQDMIGNLLTQYILSVKQNLANLNLLDRDSFSDFTEDDRNALIGRLRNFGEKWLRSLNFEWFSSRRARMGQGDIGRAVQSFRFTPLPTDGLITALRQILDLLERTLVMSAQEVASAASHEQTAEEVRIIDVSKSTRLEFTATPVDQAIYAWKNQLYNGLMAYGEPEFYAEIPHKVSEDKLKELGFTVEEKWDDESRRSVVRVNDKTAISMESFASTRDAQDRINTAAIANAMGQILSSITSNPRLMEAIGDDQALELVNIINRYMGLPQDFKLKNVGGMPPQQQLVQLAQAIQQDTLNKVGQSVAPLAEQVGVFGQNLQAVSQQTQVNSEQLAQQAQLTARLAQIVDSLAQPAPMSPMAPPPLPVQPPDPWSQ